MSGGAGEESGSRGLARAAKALTSAITRLRAAGVADPARDARWLLAHVLAIPPDRLTVALGAPLPPEAAARFEALVAERCRRRPVSQIIGRREFFGRDFRVTPAVLDPRPETECLVEEALREPFTRVVDLGTGSGAILVSLLAEWPDAHGTGVDLSPEALAVARENAARHRVADRLALLRSDWWENVTGRFDLVVSNPPYLRSDELAELAPEVRLHEPMLALDGGEDGLEPYRRILAGLGAHLFPGGRVIVEIGPEQGRDVAALFARAGLEDIVILPDLDGRDRIVRGRAPR